MTNDEWYEKDKAHEAKMDQWYDERSGYCPVCKAEKVGRWDDDGIGPYEAWGCKGWDSRPVLVCPDCEEELEER